MIAKINWLWSLGQVPALAKCYMYVHVIKNRPKFTLHDSIRAGILQHREPALQMQPQNRQNINSMVATKGS